MVGMNGWSELIDEKKEEAKPTDNNKVKVKEPNASVKVPKIPKPKVTVKSEGRKRITPLINRNLQPRKILLYGGASSGKTRATLGYLIKKIKENPNTIYWYIDTERGLTETLKEFKEDIDKHIEHFKCNDFKDILSALKLIIENAQRGDIIVVDMLSTLWDWAQSEYTLQVFDKDMTKFYLSRRKELIAEASGKPVFEGWKDWVGIKLLHSQDFIDILVRQTGADLIAICSAKQVPINEPGKPPVVLNPDIFTFVGWAPEGEKHNQHRFDTILYMWCGEKDWYYKAPKWRGNYDMLRKTTIVPPKEFPEI